MQKQSHFSNINWQETNIWKFAGDSGDGRRNMGHVICSLFHSGGHEITRFVVFLQLYLDIYYCYYHWALHFINIYYNMLFWQTLRAIFTYQIITIVAFDKKGIFETKDTFNLLMPTHSHNIKTNRNADNLEYNDSAIKMENERCQLGDKMTLLK